MQHDAAKVLEEARRSTHPGVSRRFSPCWLPDGTGVVTRHGIAALRVVPSPGDVMLFSTTSTDILVAALPDGALAKEAERIVFFSSQPGRPIGVLPQSSAFSASLLALLPILFPREQGDESPLLLKEALIVWLEGRLCKSLAGGQRLLDDPLLEAVALGRTSLVIALLAAAGRDALAQVASTVGSDDPSALDRLAKLRGAHASRDAIDELIWDVALGSGSGLMHTIASGHFGREAALPPWEAVLLSILHYSKRHNAVIAGIDAVSSRYPFVGGQCDVFMLLLRLKSDIASQRPARVRDLLDPGRSRVDWATTAAICRAVPEHLGAYLVPMQRHLKGALIASGNWHLAVACCDRKRLDVGLFLRTAVELDEMAMGERARHRRKVDFALKLYQHSPSPAAALDIEAPSPFDGALADRCGYVKDHRMQLRLLARARRYLDAEVLYEPHLLQAIIVGDDRAIRQYLACFPPCHTFLRPTSRVLSIFDAVCSASSSEADRARLIADLHLQVSQLHPTSLRQRVAFAEVAARISHSHPSPHLVRLLPDDQRRVLLHKLATTASPSS